jgi:Tol biopolymer transport system component
MKYVITLTTLLTFLMLTIHNNTPWKASILGEGVISTGNNISQAVSPNGDEIYFARMSEEGIWDIYYSEWKKGSWSEPGVASFSSPYTDADPYFTADGQKLFFLSDRPASVADKPRQMPDIWYVEQTDDGWSEPIYAEEINTEEFGETFMSLTDTGDIVFASNRDTDRNHSIFLAEYNGAGYDPPRPFPADIRVDGFANPLIARDGSYLIFESDHYEGYGADDLYIIFKEGESWTEPVNLGPEVNTEWVEGGPFVTDDGRHLMFARLDSSVDELKSDIYQIAFQPLLHKAKAKAGLD